MKPSGIKIIYNRQHVLVGANIVIDVSGTKIESPLDLYNFEEWIKDLPDSYFDKIGTQKSKNLEKLEKAYGYVSISDPRSLDEKMPILTHIKSTIAQRMSGVKTKQQNPEKE